MNSLLETVYRNGRIDNWQGTLIRVESEKVHVTLRSTIQSLTDLLGKPNTSKEDKAWAKAHIDRLLG